MMIKGNKSWLGFTLIEMLVVLFVVSVITLIPSMKIPNMERALTDVFFFEEFERLITVTQEAAVFSGQACRIAMNKGSSEIMFDYVLSTGRKKHDYLEIPKNIMPQTDTFVTFLGETGTLSKVTKFKFLIVSSKKNVVYQFYLGSGKFVKKENES